MKTPKKATETNWVCYCDLDGVMADFEQGIVNLTGKTVYELGRDPMWKALDDYLEQDGQFFAELPLMPGAMDMWNTIIEMGYTPTVLTACGKYFPEKVKAQKFQWAKQHLGEQVQFIAADRSVTKKIYATPTSILIDDRPRSIDPWREAGGIGILHTCPIKSIQELKTIIGHN